MPERMETVDETDDDEDYVEFEDVVDDFVKTRLRTMAAVGNHYPTRDGFVAQVMLLIEIALLGIPATPDSFDEAKAMTDKFSEDGISILEPPSAAWSQKVVRLGVEYIQHRRAIQHQAHASSCPNCTPPESRNN